MLVTGTVCVAHEIRCVRVGSSHLSLQRSCPDVWPSWSQLGTFFLAEWQKHLERGRKRSESRQAAARRHQATVRSSPLTFAFANEEAAGSSEVNGVVDLEALQVLTHLPTLRKLRINTFEVNLSTRQTCLEQ